MQRDAFQRLLDAELKPGAFNDVAENGLQVEGKNDINKVVCGVSANRDLIEKAIAIGADAIVVHHGIVWGGGIRRIDGWLGERVRKLMRHDVNLFAYHLPLDAQPEFGNNAGLAKALGVEGCEPFGKYKGQLIGLKGTTSTTWGEFVERAQREVGRPLAAFGDASRRIARVGLCTGGAPELLHDAIADRLDAFITGEVTEWVQSVALESGTSFLALGHHATERFGPRGLAKKLMAIGIDAEFVDVENPA
jgi:dinuclear metal center YbgI/SA1388 family protein